MDEWGTERQKDSVALIVCAILLGASVYVILDLWWRS